MIGNWDLVIGLFEVFFMYGIIGVVLLGGFIGIDLLLNIVGLSYERWGCTIGDPA